MKKISKKSNGKADIVYLVTWYGRGGRPLSLNVVKSHKSLQDYIDATLAKIRVTNHITHTEGSTPDYFKSFDTTDYNSGIYIRAKKVNDTLKDAAILNPLGTL